MADFVRALLRVSTWRMALRNVWRTPRRTAVVLLAIGVGLGGVVLAMAFNYGMIFQMVRAAIRTELGHVQIHGAGFQQKPGVEIRLPATLLDEVQRAAPATLRAVAPRVRAEGLASTSHGNIGVALLALDPVLEPTVSSLKDALVAGRWLGRERRALIGTRLAERLKLEVGDRLVVSAQDVRGDLTAEAFRVGGLLQTGALALDERAVFVTLRDGQRILGMPDEISELVLMAHSDEVAQALQKTLQALKFDAAEPAALEISVWHELRPFLKYMVDAFRQTAWVTYAAIFAAMAFGIANVLLMSVYERIRELGIMMALGMKPGRVVALLLAEALVLTLYGVAGGLAAGLLGIRALKGGIDLSRWGEGLVRFGLPTRIVPEMPLQDLLTPVGIAVVTALLAGIWPALHAVRTTPAAAVRHV